MFEGVVIGCFGAWWLGSRYSESSAQVNEWWPSCPSQFAYKGGESGKEEAEMVSSKNVKNSKQQTIITFLGTEK